MFHRLALYRQLCITMALGPMLARLSAWLSTVTGMLPVILLGVC